MSMFRLLNANEIECRVAQVKKNGLSLLLYKNARADMSILDETVGPMNWQRRHCRDNANCIVSIWDPEKKQWIEKEDTGTESNTEAEKGLASDSFKRACFNVGIGRELYTAPFIWVTPPNCEIKEVNGRYACYDRFDVSEIGYNERREINRLVIVNAKTHNVVFEFGDPSSKPLKGPSRGSDGLADKNIDQQAKRGDKPLYGRVEATGKQMATPEQLEYIKEHASDEEYEAIMLEYGAEMEKLTANQAAEEIKKIDAPKIPTCERCGRAITGVALPDGTLMNAGELIGKSKLNYNGVYCFECMKALKAAKEKKAG